MPAGDLRADVYLLPAVVGGGLGDIEEVLAAGRHLAAAGAAVHLYRRAGRPLPRSVDGPWDWPPHRTVRRLRPTARVALTVAPAWGVSCAPQRPGALGRAGPWAEEAAEIERTYGAERTAHVSLEEFARTLTLRAENLERLREGGVPARQLRAGLARAEAAGETARHREAFLRFRAFDRPNVAHLFASLVPADGFAREFPAAIVCGPMWPGRAAPRAAAAGRDWVWYASPSSAERIAPAVLAGLRGVRPTPRLVVRASRPWRFGIPEPRGEIRVAPEDPGAWHRRLAAASVRIVTGSRTLLEAMELGRPFLYFNGVLGGGRRPRRHRPEKALQLLRVARAAGWPADLCRDLEDFSRGHRVAEITARAARAAGGWRRFPACPALSGFRPEFQDAGRLVVRLARALAAGDRPASEIIAELRRRSHR